MLCATAFTQKVPQEKINIFQAHPISGFFFSLQKGHGSTSEEVSLKTPFSKGSKKTSDDDDELDSGLTLSVFLVESWTGFGRAGLMSFFSIISNNSSDFLYRLQYYYIYGNIKFKNSQIYILYSRICFGPFTTMI